MIRLLEYRRIPHQTRALSRKNISAARPQHLPVLRGADAPGELTLDHVIRAPAAGFYLGEPGGLLPSLQPAKGKPIPG